MNLFRRAGKCCAILVLAATTACTATGSDDDFAALDSHENISREFHDFNTGWDQVVIRPAAKTYDKLTPTLVQHLVTNGFSHLTLPRDFANYLLQGRLNPALETLGRFAVNTIVGAGGLLDPATEFGLPKQDTDFGVTLARHGSGEGGYFVFPFLGPATPRDFVGRVVDLAFAPTSYIGMTLAESAAERGAETVEFRDRYMEPIDEVLYESEDSYITMRTVYLQHRRAMIAGGGAEAEGLPNIFEQN